MKLSELKNLFKTRINFESFKKEIEKEILVYKNQLREKGTSISIHVQEDIENFEIKKNDVILLCKAYLERIFDKWEVNYIAEGLSLCENVIFDDDKTEEAIQSLADAEFDKLVNDEFINRIIQELQT